MSKLDDFLKFTSSPEGLKLFQEAIPGTIHLRDMGPYALSRMTDLAGTAAAFPHGELRATLSGVSVSPCAVEGCTGEAIDEKTVRVTLSLSAMDLSSQYVLSAIEQPKVDLDTGGGLRPISELTSKADGDPDGMTEDQYDKLQQADEEREDLNETTNGQALVAKFNSHNEDYNTVFQTNSALRAAWSKNGATKAMMDHTSTALKSDTTVINPTDQTFGDANETYNQVAFARQMNVYLACYGAGFTDAANACSDFSDDVTNSTANDGTTIKPLTRTDVYNYVAQGTLSESFVVAGVAAGVAAGAGVGAAAPRRPGLSSAEFAGIAHRIGSGTHTDGDIEAMRSRGYRMSDRDIDTLQKIYQEASRGPGAAASAELWRGGVNATVPACRFAFVLTLRGNGAITTELKTTSMPIPELRIDDTAWSGEAGAMARTRLHGAHFIRALIHDRMADAIERVIASKVSAWSP